MAEHARESSSGAATACPACAGADGVAFWRAERVPALCHGLCDSRAAALNVRRGTIELTLCRDCGLVYNRAFDPTRLSYSGQYENALHFSPRFRQYADGLAEHLVTTRGVRGGRVMEIGCGDGYFLERLCRLGGNQGLGLDPAHDVQRSALNDDVDVRIVASPFDAQMVSAFPADLICCRHVLEHLEDPLTLLRTLRAALDGREQTMVYFEVPNLLHTLERMGIWDLIYEHCVHFTPATLRRLFRMAGFEAIDSGDAYGRQFAWIEAVPARGEPTEGDRALPGQLEDLVTSFDVWCHARMSQMRERLQHYAEASNPALVWGAGSKAVTMLNVLGLDDATVPAVVDQNPRKHGHYVSGTGQRIIAPEEVPRWQPPAVVVMNPLYRAEVAQQLEEFGMRPGVMVA